METDPRLSDDLIGRREALRRAAILLGSVLSAPVAREGGAARDVEDDVVGEIAERGVPVAALRRGEVVADELSGRHRNDGKLYPQARER